MQEVRRNIIVTAEEYYVYSHDISNPKNTIITKLLDGIKTRSWYYTIEGLYGGQGNMAIGGHSPNGMSWYGYVQLFHLDINNAKLHPIADKLWMNEDSNCYIRIIREIQVGVLVLGGDTNCEHICTWKYAVLPHQQPICFSIGGSYIYDIIPLKYS